MNRLGGTERGRWVGRVAVAGAVWVAAAAASVGVGAVELARGQAAARSAQHAASAALPRGESRGADELREASAHFGRARLLLANPLVAPVRVAPVVGRQVRVAAAVAGTGRRVADAGAVALDRLGAVLERPPTDGAARVRTADELVDLLGDARRSVGTVDLGPDDALLPSVARRRRQVAAQADEAIRSLTSGEAAAQAVADLVHGPRRYLLLAANNAEMRAGSGMFLSAGTLTTAAGDLTLSPMRRTEELTLPGDGVPYDEATADLAARWGFTHPNREWRNLGMSARFDQTAPLAARMWEASTGERVDGVLAIDVIGLTRLVDATGPVDIDGTSYDAKAIEPYLLHDQYASVVEGKARSAAQAERREDLGLIAAAVTDHLTSGRFDTGGAAQALFDAVAGRHVLAWAADPDVQAGWAAAGVAGGLDGDEVLLSLLNRGGNKLDPLLRMEATLSGAPTATGVAFTAEVTIRNLTSARELPYVAGPGGGLPDPPGTALGFLTLHLPGAAEAVAVDGAPVVAAGGDGPTRVVGAQVVVARGGEATVTFRFSLPDADGSFTIAPSARIPPTRWTVGQRHRTDRLAQQVVWRDRRIVSGA